MSEAAPLAGSTAVVTGATRGIGLEVARLLAEAGARVAVVARTGADVDRVADAIGGVAAAGDIASPSGAAAACERAVEGLGGVPDILVNAAGGFHLSPIVETDPEDFKRQLDLNLGGSFYTIRALLPAFLQRGSGHVVNVGSIAGRVAMPGNGAYSASKFGLVGLHAVLAEEVRGTGVLATLVEPAATDTPLWDHLDPDSHADLPPRASMLRADEVARAVVYALTQPRGVEISSLSIRSAR